MPHSEFLSWDPEDRAKTVAALLEQAERCQMCGTAAWEWSEDRFAYTPIDHFCQGCYQKNIYQDTISHALPGTTVKLVPTTPMLKAKMAVNAKRMAGLSKE